jgi:hypothetical protein
MVAANAVAHAVPMSQRNRVSSKFKKNQKRIVYNRNISSNILFSLKLAGKGIRDPSLFVQTRSNSGDLTELNREIHQAPTYQPLDIINPFQ